MPSAFIKFLSVHIIHPFLYTFQLNFILEAVTSLQSWYTLKFLIIIVIVEGD